MTVKYLLLMTNQFRNILSSTSEYSYAFSRKYKHTNTHKQKYIGVKYRQIYVEMYVLQISFL